MSMVHYKVPYSEASAEFVEKKSRFIGHIFKVTSAQQATEIIKQMQKKYWDASCNAYGYIVEEGTPEEVILNPKEPRTIDFLSKVL